MQDIPVKERLTGAIILVALLVLLVPELLTGPGRSAKSDGSAATGQATTGADGAQMRSYTINLADGAAAQGTSGAPVTETPPPENAKPAETPQAEAPDAMKSGSSQTESSGTSPSAVERPLPPSDTSSTEPERPIPNVPKPRAQAPERSVAVPTPRADPPPVSKPASEPAPRTAAESHSGAGWAIQVGSFASRENAERLARELKGKGFAATVSQYTKGKRLWRVRVGPEPDRAAAVALGARLRTAGHAGSAVPYP